MKFSKKDTAVVKGVAIMFLLAYHCFSSVERFNGCEVNFYPLSQKAAMYICETMNICVGMFAFLSSYGLTKTIKLKNPALNMNADESVSFVTKRAVSLLGSFFLPYILCTASTLLFSGHNPYGEGVSFVCNAFVDMLGLAGLLRTPMMIGTWWYMSFALVIIFLMPFSVQMYKKYGILLLIPFGVLPVLFVPEFRSSGELTNMTRWLLTIPLGIIFADADLLEKLKAYRISKNKIVNKIIKFAVLTAILYILIRLRTSSWGKEKFYYYISSILPVFVVYYLYEFITDIPIVSTVTGFLGKHSSNIFFMHTFIRGVWFPVFTYSFKYAALIYLFMLGASLLLSFAVEWLKKLLHWNNAVKIVAERLTKFVGKIFFEKNPVSKI